ncbi:hypothetical protein GRX03_12780 [Halovenus sp. WSH3]|uniref:ATP phosphoribosyltransferase n=1 Tax=Halovenus carboxidivorans TaxID=2692199 RepID=A0A6B0T6C5_9EURY|nr:hypothetical protein [Halovenus carboxidivorans]MXR52477.1 hypothetical protein [Halovenus carboxidivorans]
MEPIRVAVPRKGRPLEAVLERVARSGFEETADEIISTLRYEKAITKGERTDERTVYERLASYSDLSTPEQPEFTLFRDARKGMPRRIVFDSITLPFGDRRLQLVGREEPLRALRKHEFALGFDSADLVLEEIVSLADEPLRSLQAVNERISPSDTDVRLVTGLGDTVHHTLLARPNVLDSPDQPLDRAFISDYSGPLCVSPRYERLVEATLGSKAVEGVEFTYPEEGQEEEAAIAECGLGVYLTVTGSTAREHGLLIGERLFPSETVLLSNVSEMSAAAESFVEQFLATSELETAMPPSQ